ncbi:MAG: hypothetical protein N2554_08730, partial [Fimbriimonadales bacterium]|nr:hypothetical protein [Fimbriimonadales bacterium]
MWFARAGRPCYSGFSASLKRGVGCFARAGRPCYSGLSVSLKQGDVACTGGTPVLQWLQCLAQARGWMFRTGGTPVPRVRIMKRKTGVAVIGLVALFALSLLACSGGGGGGTTTFSLAV